MIGATGYVATENSSEGTRPGSAGRHLGGRVLRVATRSVLVAMMAIVVVAGQPAQDLLPFQAGFELLQSGHPEAVYPEPDAASLFDVHPAFTDMTLAITRGRYPRDKITGHIAPPPSLIIGQLVPADSPLASRLWLAAMSLMLLACLFALERDLLREAPTAELAWHLTLIGMLPLWLYVLAIGQNTPFLMVAVTLSVLPPSTRRSLLGGLALGIASATKLFPLPMIVVAALLKRSLMAAVAVAVVTLLSLFILATAPLSLWSDFASVASSLGSRVIAGWNNAALEAGLTVLAGGQTSALWVLPPPWVRATGIAFRALIVALAAYKCLRLGSAPPLRRWSLAWLALFACVPLLWNHYLICLVPLLQLELKAGRRVLPVLVSASQSAGLIALSSLGREVASLLSLLGWVLAATTLLWLAFAPPARALGDSNAEP